MTYPELLQDIKTRIRQSQIKATMSVNSEMLALYWDVGRLIHQRQNEKGWGAKIIPQLSKDIRNELPELKGFSERNIKRMLAFYREYSWLLIVPQPVAQLPEMESNPGSDWEHVIVPQPVAQLDMQNIMDIQGLIFRLPWSHNFILMEKVKDLKARRWYMEQALAVGWGRDTLESMIQNDAFSRKGKAVTNFATQLPAPQSELAIETLKDPFIFDFLTLEEPFHERELETGLIQHLEKFLLELGAGFAFIGRQYHVVVSDQDFYVDLLLYHLKLRCYVVVELKKGPFKPEYAGKLSFYCSVIDDYLRHEQDQKTIGLILCQNKDKVLADYVLRGFNTPIGVSDYELTKALPKELRSSLPSIEEIERVLGSEKVSR
jgi:predicted nuclease of restriction endonuclease-like (RecB) superfamily